MVAGVARCVGASHLPPHFGLGLKNQFRFLRTLVVTSSMDRSGSSTSFSSCYDSDGTRKYQRRTANASFFASRRRIGGRGAQFRTVPEFNRDAWPREGKTNKATLIDLWESASAHCTCFCYAITLGMITF